MNDFLIKLFTGICYVGTVIVALLAIAAMVSGLLALIRYFLGLMGVFV